MGMSGAVPLNPRYFRAIRARLRHHRRRPPGSPRPRRRREDRLQPTHPPDPLGQLLLLPRPPAEVAAFVADARPAAYERQVDRLLASPHYGERMAAPWLDAVRFADTVGFHGDQNQNVFPYRDYVINAFNANKPFDQFTIEQLAGDLLPNPTTEHLTATCFNRLHLITHEG